MNNPSQGILLHNEHIVDATLLCYNKRYNPHIGSICVISIIGVADRSPHIEFHDVHMLYVSLIYLKHSYVPTDQCDVWGGGGVW